MARPVYSHELSDPDFSWLISSFREAHPHYHLVDEVGQPLVLIPLETPKVVGLPLPPGYPPSSPVDPEPPDE